jgi:hypothetical protein
MGVVASFKAVAKNGIIAVLPLVVASKGIKVYYCCIEGWLPFSNATISRELIISRDTART